MLAVGETAPDFKLTTLGEDGPKHITLSENLGQPTVLLFVPMAFTSVCTKELCSVTEEMSEYESLDANILAISGDSPFAQAAWAEKEGIKLTLASDYEHNVAKEYGIAYESFLPEKNLTMGGVPKRSAFVIDANGIIQYAESSDDPAQVPDFEGIKSKLVELKN
ncbi:MAG: redoxin domain-containing protein [Akkermansiaceae bacterium]|jgi:glutaredoxin-dependent peroxiredoxin|nr:redoxin domain-containing protein [Akkermansiaceae bacterium]MDG1853248.1 redoxin domain-containing protein [Verrucomicrobiales bacterium]